MRRGSSRRLSGAKAKLDGMKIIRANTAADFTGYRDEPVKFATEVLGVKSATRRSDSSTYQSQWLEAVLAHPRSAFVCGHGVGKTRFLAMAALWWLLTRQFGRVLVVAPQLTRQVHGVVFSEIRKLVRRAKVPLPVEVFAGTAHVIGYGAEWSIVGLPATEPDRIEGQHAEGGLLLLMDEVKGVPQGSFDALMGALTGGDDSRLVIASVPGGVSGPFYRACADDRGLWQVYDMSAEDSSLVSPRWCADRALEWGKESPLYQTRVLGQFAHVGDGQLFGLALLDKASQPGGEATGEVVLGIDVARSVSGDQNCICVARGGTADRFVLWRSPDLTVTEARVVDQVLATQPKRIRIDAGGVGGGLADRLQHLGFRVEAINFGGQARDPKRFKNVRAEMFWQLREGLEKGRVHLPDDDELVADLTALRYGFTQDGKVQLDGKDEVRKRLGRSPDRADSLALAAYARPRPSFHWVELPSEREEREKRQRWRLEAEVPITASPEFELDNDPIFWRRR